MFYLVGFFYPLVESPIIQIWAAQKGVTMKKYPKESQYFI